MGTQFKEIVNRSLIIIKDYKLDKVYIENPAAFEAILNGYLVKGLPLFNGCLKSLEYNIDEKAFVSSLDIYEIDILANLTVMVWYEDNINDVLEYKETLQDRAYKRLATGQNLKPRYEHLSKMRSQIKQDITNYQFMNLSFPYLGGENNG